MLGVLKKGVKTGSKTKKKDPLSFQSLLKNPTFRSLTKVKSNKKGSKKGKFYEALILDTKPTDQEKEKNVVAYIIHYCLFLSSYFSFSFLFLFREFPRILIL